MTYKVLKPFYIHSNKQNYKVDETIELSKEDALGMLKEGYLEEVKETKEQVIKILEDYFRFLGKNYHPKLKETKDWFENYLTLDNEN